MDTGDLNRNLSVSQRKKVKERIAIIHSFDLFSYKLRQEFLLRLFENYWDQS